MTGKRGFKVAVRLVMVIFIFILSTIECYAEIKFRVVHFGELVDNESGAADCLSCHDSMAAKGVGFQNWGHRSNANPLYSHPVEAPYPAEWSGNARYAQQSDIQKLGLRLHEGEVSCITCHDLRLQGSEHFLPVTMKGSELCFACHRI